MFNFHTTQGFPPTPVFYCRFERKRIPRNISKSLPLTSDFCINVFYKKEKLIISFQMKYNDPVSKQSSLSPLSANKPPNFTFLPPPISSTPWSVARASPTCPNRTWLQIRLSPHPVLRKDLVKQLILHVNKDRCKGNNQAESLHISMPASQSSLVGKTKPIPLLGQLSSSQTPG